MKFYKIILSLLLGVALTGCFYDNKEDLLTEMNEGGGVPGPIGCETDSISYSGFIQPLLNSNCRSCHRQGSANAGIRLDTYAFVQATARTGQLVGVMKRRDGLPLMPPSGALDDCTIAQVESWVKAGALEN
ncbi:MAG: hypothetical protein MRZ79_10725 [Bacteroidia bacterium]|nr:hypothetical protein [Bacteroidia bacterium]